ncbi:hypothetical protein ABK040_004456 [Willaertia magna]
MNAEDLMEEEDLRVLDDILLSPPSIINNNNEIINMNNNMEGEEKSNSKQLFVNIMDIHSDNEDDNNENKENKEENLSGLQILERLKKNKTNQTVIGCFLPTEAPELQQKRTKTSKHFSKSLNNSQGSNYSSSSQQSSQEVSSPYLVGKPFNKNVFVRPTPIQSNNNNNNNINNIKQQNSTTTSNTSSFATASSALIKNCNNNDNVLIDDNNIPIPKSLNQITVSIRQKGNPILNHIRPNIMKLNYSNEWKITDYILGSKTVALFLSLKYHMTNPKYILERIKAFHKTEYCKLFTIKVLLVNIDVNVGDMTKVVNTNTENPNLENNRLNNVDNSVTFISEFILDDCLIELTRISMWADFTLVSAFSDEECALYLETFRYCESKNANLIKGINENLNNSSNGSNNNNNGKKKYNRRKSSESSSSSTSNNEIKVPENAATSQNAQHALNGLKFLHKRDSVTLLNHFSSFKELMQSTPEQLEILPGFGKKKVKRLHQLFHTNFKGEPSNVKEGNNNTEEEEEDDDLIIVSSEKKQATLGKYFKNNENSSSSTSTTSVKKKSKTTKTSTSTTSKRGRKKSK